MANKQATNKRVSDFQVYLEDDTNNLIKATPCTAMGDKLHLNAASPHALVDVTTPHVHVKLPAHRVFLRIRYVEGKIQCTEVTGTVIIPNVQSSQKYFSSYLSEDSIVEVDIHNITKDSYFVYPNDINNYFVPPNNYMFLGQLIAYRGNKVTSIWYMEPLYAIENHSQLRFNISKINELPGTWGPLEQAYRTILSKRATQAAIPSHTTPLSNNGASIPKASSSLLNPGTQLLRIASTIRGGNRFLIKP